MNNNNYRYNNSNNINNINNNNDNYGKRKKKNDNNNCYFRPKYPCEPEQDTTILEQEIMIIIITVTSE